MTNLLQIIMLLQMALSLLTASQNIPNEAFKKNAIDFSNQAIGLALKEIQNIPQVPVTQPIVSNPVQVGQANQSVVETPIAIAPSTTLVTSTPKLELIISNYWGNGDGWKITNTSQYDVLIKKVEIRAAGGDNYSIGTMSIKHPTILNEIVFLRWPMEQKTFTIDYETLYGGLQIESGKSLPIIAFKASGFSAIRLLSVAYEIRGNTKTIDMWPDFNERIYE